MYEHLFFIFQKNIYFFFAILEKEDIFFKEAVILVLSEVFRETFPSIFFYRRKIYFCDPSTSLENSLRMIFLSHFFPPLGMCLSHIKFFFFFFSFGFVIRSLYSSSQCCKNSLSFLALMWWTTAFAEKLRRLRPLNQYLYFSKQIWYIFFLNIINMPLLIYEK